jgi:hypothetical protein
MFSFPLVVLHAGIVGKKRTTEDCRLRVKNPWQVSTWNLVNAKIPETIIVSGLVEYFGKYAVPSLSDVPIARGMDVPTVDDFFQLVY